MYTHCNDIVIIIDVISSSSIHYSYYISSYCYITMTRGCDAVHARFGSQDRGSGIIFSADRDQILLLSLLLLFNYYYYLFICIYIYICIYTYM